MTRHRYSERSVGVLFRSEPFAPNSSEGPGLWMP